MKIQYLWASTASSISVLMGGLPIAQAIEVIQPYTPRDLQVPHSPLSDPLTDSLIDPLDQSSGLGDQPPLHLKETTSPYTVPEPSPPPSLEVGLSFALPSRKQGDVGNAVSHPPHQTGIPSSLPAAWWTMGSDSPIAIAIGMAEGTRTLDGGKTPAYYWHEDPGNGANNFGTFSYQHLPPTKTSEVDRQASNTAKREVAKADGLPELSDRLQLQRLDKFYRQLQQQANARGIELTTLEILNGLDLANQSEAAALSPWGYIDRLVQMRSLLPGQQEEQIREARTWSYWSPDRNAWDAPGLGNHYLSIRQDQDRRFAAVQQALKIRVKIQ